MIRAATNEEIRRYVAYKKKYGISNRGAMTPDADDFHYALLMEDLWLMPHYGNLHFAHFDYTEIHKLFTTPADGKQKTIPSRKLGPRSWACLKEKLTVS